ncbi:MAG: class I SAM-dependent methyltransferase [Deinococcales bacterium]
MSLRVARAYDRNRYHPPEVSGKIATAIYEPLEREYKGSQHLLEIGVGTGRIAMPIVARGATYTGVDIDPEMMSAFRSKFAGVSRRVSLVNADAQDLPFHDNSFQAVIAVHVWHLVPDLTSALDEAVRVLTPNGFLFEGWDSPDASSAELEIQDAWCRQLEKMGHPVQRGGHRAALNASLQYLEGRGFHPEEVVVSRWEVSHTPLEVVEALEDGLYSFTKNIPLELRFEAGRAIKPFLLERYKELETPIKTPWSFHLRTTRVPRF